MAATDPLPFRVYSEPDGKIYLLYEPQNWRIEVEKPLTEESLEIARLALGKLGEKELQDAFIAAEGESDASATPQQLANRQIKAVVEPSERGFLFRLGESLLELFVVVYVIGLALYAVYAFVHFLQLKRPDLLHLLVLLVCAVGLALSIYLIAVPERLNEKQRKFWFGKNGLLALSCFNLVGAASAFASLTFWLYQKQLVILQPCREDSPPVTAGSLLDFYMVHLLKLVPFLKLNEALKWNEPVCYTQKRVGLLVLLFQGLVVLPCINAIRYHLKNRKLASAKPYKYIYEPGWRPESNLEP